VADTWKTSLFFPWQFVVLIKWRIWDWTFYLMANSITWPADGWNCLWLNTGMCRITKFRSTMERLQGSGPVRLYYNVIYMI
jgi:hypothetical protein